MIMWGLLINFRNINKLLLLSIKKINLRINKNVKNFRKKWV